ncbi:MAG: molecular chaperone DnaJ [Psychrilyobacter sp.]|nr:molecular chaperone DnaJ [Psychrilyobacter sp.]
MSKQDFYETLGVSKGANESEIKKAYRKKAMKYHPDKFGSASGKEKEDAEHKFKEVNDAYQVLSDNDKKSKYDRFGHDAFSQGGGGQGGFGGFGGFSGSGGGFEDIFGSFFGGGGSRGHRAEPGADLQYTVEITLEEAAKGTEKEVKYYRKGECHTCHGTGAKPGSEMKTCSACNGQGRVKEIQRTMFGNFENVVECSVCNGTGKVPKVKCPTCHGTGNEKELVKKKIKIPAGIDDGQRLRLGGMGEASEDGGSNGDLYLFIKVKEHTVFERHGSDIICEVPISYAKAVLGGEIEIPTLEGTIKIKIPEGTQTGKIFKLRGKGIPSTRGGRVGDELVKVVVETPKHLNADQKALLEEFDKSLKEKNTKINKGFFDKVKHLFK